MVTESDPLFEQRGEVATLIRSRDWSATPLGPPLGWSPSLTTVLRLMLGSRYSMWMGWGPELTYFYNDAYAQQTLGPKHPNALGRPFAEVWAEVWPTLRTRIEHVLATGEATWDEGLLLFLERNGYPEETYHTFSYSPAPGDRAGETAGLFCVVIEETDRVLGERRLTLLKDLASRLSRTGSTEEVLAAVESCLAAGARDIPFALTYLVGNDAEAPHLVSHAGFESSAAALVDLVQGSSAPWPFAEVQVGGTSVVTELSTNHGWPMGAWSRPPHAALVVPLSNPGQGRLSGFFVAGLNPHRPVDRSVQSFVELFAGQIAAGLINARAREEEKERADGLAEIDRAKTLFFSNVSHEFRTPLTLMLGPTEDALSSPERALRGADLETVHRNELRLLKLVNTLLDFARTEAGRAEVSYQPIDLQALTIDLVSSFRSAIERAGLELRVTCEATGVVHVDRDMWEKIVLNLLSNALKFTFHGHIAVDLRLHAGEAVLEVSDSGVGISEDELPRLFERFHRVEGSRSRTHEGSGIGLALVRDLVKLHAGTISVASKLDVGSTFTIAVPQGTAHLPADRIAKKQVPLPALSAAFVSEAVRWVEAATPARQHAALPRTDRPRIVIADDNADMRDYLARLLGERWEVVAVGDGEAALDEIRQRTPDLILADVMMPRLDGFELLRAVRSDATLRAVPLILLSARAGEEAAAEGLSAGADDYIAKPFAARDLLVRVASRLASASAAREANAIKENLYRHFVQAPFPVAVFRGPEHIVELANGATLRAWGRTADEAVGRPLLAVLPGLRDQPFLGYLDDVFRSGQPYTGQAELARLPAIAGGEEEIYFTFIYAPLIDSSGATEGVLMSAFDVTAQVHSRLEVERARDKAERLALELSTLSDRLRAAQKVGRIGTFEWELGSSVVQGSAELYELMGLAEGAAVATKERWTAQLFEDSDRAVAREAFERARKAHDETMEAEVRLRQPDGRSRWVRVSSEIHYGEDGRPIRLLGAAVDIQLLKEAAEARARALADVERTSRAKDEFLATMSHELRTPLNAVLGWSNLLTRSSGRDAGKIDHGLAVITRNAQAQARLIDDLLDVSRIISGKLHLVIKAVDVSAVVRAAVDVVRQSADAKGIELVVAVDPGVGSMVGDADRLQQIVWNLLSNAIKFTSAGGQVSVEAERRESRVVVRVRDTGAGIAPQHLQRIFERFQQVDSSTTRGHGGLGLGLAIVRHLVEAHGGTARAHSEGEGKGSVFTVDFPLRAVFADLEGADSITPAGEARGEAGDAAGVLAGRRLLIVDDEVDSLELLRLVLEGAGAHVTTSADVTTALALFTPAGFDAVISDIGMPEVDGYTFMKKLRAQDAATPAIALTAYVRAEDAARARASGFNRHLAKPIDAEELIGAVRQLLGLGP